MSNTDTNITQSAIHNIGTSTESPSMPNITTEIEHLSISSPDRNGRNVHSSDSIISSTTITQQPQPDNAESATLPVPAPIRKWRWPKPSERRRKAVTPNTNTSIDTNPDPPPETRCEIIWKKLILEQPPEPATILSSPPTLSLSHGFSRYWEDISDEELITYIPPNIIQIWNSRIAQRRAQARAAGAEYERELEEELEEKYGAMVRYGSERNGEAFVEGLLEMVEECDLAGVVRERGRRAFWEGDGVCWMDDGRWEMRDEVDYMGDRR